jgi:hypothetical protein
MALSDKMKEATTKAKKGTAADKGRLEKAVQKAGAFAEEHSSEVRERIAKARHHNPPSKPKRGRA